MIDLNDATTVKTLKFLDIYYRYRGKGKSIEYLLVKALGKNKGAELAARTPSTTDAQVTQRSSPNGDYRDTIH